MQKLPRGYYAVKNDFENADKSTFVFQGVCYEVEEGVNLFGTPHAAHEAATETPTEVLPGLNYDSFEAPVLLFSEGQHDTKAFYLTKACYLLGQHAGVNPNVPAASKTEAPTLDPIRADEGETVFYGSHIEMKGVGDRILNVIDGVTLLRACVWDSRSAAGEDYTVIQRNIVFRSYCNGYMNRIFSPKEDSKIRREVIFEHCYMKDMDDMNRGGMFAMISTAKLVLDDCTFDGTTQIFGFTNIARTFRNCVKNAEYTDIEIKNCYFRSIGGENGICTSLEDGETRGLRLTVSDSVFVDASRKGEAALQPTMPNDKCALTVKGCTFVDTRGNDAAVCVRGMGKQITLEDCSFAGFAREWAYAVPLPTNAPEKIENRASDWESGTEDSHTVLAEGSADFSAMDALYEGKKAYRVDQHMHSQCGGTSDGTFPLKDMVAKLDEIGVDVIMLVDHRQMRGFFLPEWDTERFTYGTEPGGRITDLRGAKNGANAFHYNMFFKKKYDLALLLANFPEYKFQGDELTGKFGYPKFTQERFDELVAFIHKIGGMISHPHPASIMCTEDITAYSFGEHTYFETLYATPDSHDSFRNYELWVRMLQAGLHVYTAAGTDSHGTPHNSVVSTFYMPKRSGDDAFDCMKTGDYAAGDFGIKMCVDGNPMGSESVYREGSVLTLRVEDGFDRHIKDNTAYELRIYSDEGLVYRSMFDGKHPQALALKTKKRRFYRAEIFDLTHDYRVGVGNPVWLDKAEESAEA